MIYANTNMNIPSNIINAPLPELKIDNGQITNWNEIVQWLVCNNPLYGRAARIIENFNLHNPDDNLYKILIHLLLQQQIAQTEEISKLINSQRSVYIK